MGAGQKFGVLLCAEDSEYVKKMYGGYFEVFVTMLREEGESWDLYRVVEGDFPKDNEIESYDGFVISGSSKDAHGNDFWISKLFSLLIKLDSMKKKVLGICFGHQILSRALGGKSGRAITGWDIGIRAVHLSSSSKLLSSLKVPPMLSIYEIHRDEVCELPPKAELLAWSDKTGVEMFRFEDHMMGIQGHPEYTKDILLNLIDRLVNLHYILILSRALGGKSGRAITGWDIGIRAVHLSSSSKLLSSLKVPPMLSIYEIHRDEVCELPPKAELLAWSDKTGVEMFRFEDHMMGIQGHPEYTKDILLNLIDRLVNLHYILESEAEELKAKVEAREPDREIWKRLCINFLKGRL